MQCALDLTNRDEMCAVGSESERLVVDDCEPLACVQESPAFAGEVSEVPAVGAEAVANLSRVGLEVEIVELRSPRSPSTTIEAPSSLTMYVKRVPSGLNTGRPMFACRSCAEPSTTTQALSPTTA
jgi:hypothetical protein